MKKKIELRMTEETKMLLPFRVKGTGELHAIVLHKNKFLRVPAPPYEIIDYNLRLYGSSLRGAKDSAKQMLGSSSMYPVALGKNKEWIWFMTEAMKNEHCAWFALHHVWKISGLDKKNANILLYCGHEEKFHVSERSLTNRKDKGHLLQSKLFQSVYPHPFLYSQPHENFGLVSEGNSVQYEVENKDIDEDLK